MPAVIQIFPFELPLQSPFTTAKGTTRTRRGLLVRVQAGQAIGWGEASPLPGLSTETLEEVNGELMGIHGHALQLPEALTEVNPLVHKLCQTPSGRHGLGSAVLSCMAQINKTPVSGLLNSVNHREVPVSHLYTDDDALFHATMLGTQTVKVKVGIAPLSTEVQKIAHIRELIGPDVHLRLDANGAWTEAEATAAIASMREHGVRSIEDPVKASDLDAMARLRGRGIDIVADEVRVSPMLLGEVIRRQAADVIVIKPMRVGTPLTALGMIAAADKAGLECFITTTIDSAVGRMMALHIAAAAPVAELRACGLNTGSWLQEDVGLTPDWSGSHIDSPSAPGLGVQVKL